MQLILICLLAYALACLITLWLWTKLRHWSDQVERESYGPEMDAASPHDPAQWKYTPPDPKPKLIIAPGPNPFYYHLPKTARHSSHPSHSSH